MNNDSTLPSNPDGVRRKCRIQSWQVGATGECRRLQEGCSLPPRPQAASSVPFVICLFNQPQLQSTLTECGRRYNKNTTVPFCKLHPRSHPLRRERCNLPLLHTVPAPVDEFTSRAQLLPGTASVFVIIYQGRAVPVLRSTPVAANRTNVFIESAH